MVKGSKICELVFRKYDVRNPEIMVEKTDILVKGVGLEFYIYKTLS